MVSRFYRNREIKRCRWTLEMREVLQSSQTEESLETVEEGGGIFGFIDGWIISNSERPWITNSWVNFNLSKNIPKSHDVLINFQRLISML
jgi:hypothetical protein